MWHFPSRITDLQDALTRRLCAPIRKPAMVASGGKKDVKKVDESQFHQDGKATPLVRDAPFFDRTSPMTPYEWYVWNNVRASPLADILSMLTIDRVMCRTKTVLLFPLFLVRLILCLLGLLVVWIFMQLLLVGAPTKDPFEPWREEWIRGTVRTAGKMMIVASASPR